MNDNDTVLVNKSALIKFIEAFKEYGYGQSSDMSVPDEWHEIIDISCAVRSGAYKQPVAAPDMEMLKLKRELAKAALCILENPYGAITDTIWLSESRNGGSTLFEHLVGHLDIEIEGTYEQQEQALKDYLHNTAKALAAAGKV